MAIPDNYIDRITDIENGDRRYICPAADKVRVDNDNFEGTDLDEVLDEIADAIDDAGSGGYTPPQGGIPKTDLAHAVQESLDKADTSLQPSDKTQLQAAITSLQTALNTLIGSGNVQGVIDTFNEVKAFLNGIDTSDPTLRNQLLALSNAITALQTALSGKANAADVVKGIRAYGSSTNLPKSQDGIVTLPEVQAGDQVSVVQPDPADGTFIIRVGSNDYTINLNHTHEGMAKLVVDTAANLPDVSEMDSDTIYGEVDDGEIAMLYIGCVPFYGGGGGSVSTPVLRQPTDGSSIDVGSVASGETSVSKTIKVKGKNLTQALTIEVDGTGYAFGNTQPSGVTIVSTTELTVTAAAANALNGVDIVVVYTGSDLDAAGTLGITSSEVSCECSLIANVPSYTELAGVKTTGLQYIMLDYHTNPNTKMVIDMQFEENANKLNTSAGNTLFGTSVYPESGKFGANFGSESLQYREVFYWMNQGYVSDVWHVEYDDIFVRGTWTYENDAVVFLGETTPTEHKTTTQNGYFVFGAAMGSNQNMSIFNRHNIKIFSIKISEGGTMLLNLVPRLRNDGAVGLLDTINNKFYTSETSDALVSIS